MIFDCHAHILSDDVERYPVAPLGGELRPGELDDPVTAERLIGFMDEHEVRQAVLVQRAYVYGFNNDYVLDSAEKHPERLRALCMVDARSAATPESVRRLLTERNAIGIRLTEPHKGSDTAWFCSAEALRTWSVVAELGASMRLHLFRWNRAECLPDVEKMARRFPATNIVIDHLSNLAAEEGPPEYGVDDSLRRLMELDNVYLMFSTINLGKLAAAGKPAAPVLAHLVAEFGSARIMWGSDIGQSRQSYAEMCALAGAATAALSVDERDSVMFRTGRSVYGWHDDG